MRVEIDKLKKDSHVALNERYKNVYNKNQVIRINDFRKHLHINLVMCIYMHVKSEFREKVTPHVSSPVE